jgi:hypothetical protein
MDGPVRRGVKGFRYLPVEPRIGYKPEAACFYNGPRPQEQEREDEQYHQHAYPRERFNGRLGYFFG